MSSVFNKDGVNLVANGINIFWIEVIIIQSMTHKIVDQIPLIFTEQSAVDVSELYDKLSEMRDEV